MNCIARYLVILFSLLLLIEPWGCASPTPRYPLSPPHPPSEEARARIGIIGVASASYQPEVHFHKAIGKGEGAFYGALQGMDAMAQTFSGDGYGALLGVFFLPLGALAGSADGSEKGLPKEEKEKADAALTQAITDLRLQEAMRDRLVEAGRQQTDYSFVLLEGQGPATLKEDKVYQLPDTTDIDIVLEVSMQSFGLKGKGVNPPLAFFMNVQTRFVRATDGEEIQCDTFQYHSIERSFTEWAADDARHFREEFERGFEGLAERIVDVLFLIYTPNEGSTS